MLLGPSRFNLDMGGIELDEYLSTIVGMAETGRIDEGVIETLGIQLDPLDQQLAANLRGDFEEGWRLSQLLEKERPQDDRAAFNRGWMEMWRGNLLKGFELIERGRRAEVFGSKPPSKTVPRWNGEENISGKTVLLNGEGGFGDEIANARFAKLLAKRGARVIASAHPGLVSLFERVEGVAEVIPHSALPDAAYDYWVPAMSAALPLKLSYETLPNEPYMAADFHAERAWGDVLDRQSTGKLKIGIRWSGNPKFEHEQHRRFPPEPLIALSELPGVAVFSLQRDHDIRDLPEQVIDLQHRLETWEDTAAVIANLDLVITSCTATAHLAGAMGKEVWVITPILPYYIWAKPGDTSPWYKTARLFRQEAFGNWDAPLQKIRIELEKRVGLPPRTRMAEQTPAPPQRLGPIVPPGMVLAPKPHARKLKEGEKMMHFIAGLPRAGSTALISLLAQNPKFYGAPLSGLCGIFAGVYANWDKNESHIEMPNPDAKRRILEAMLHNYHDTNRPIILDKNRQWVMHIALLENLLKRPIKLIIPVRPIPEILASFEALRRKTPVELTIADEGIGEGTTIAGRAQYFAGPGGALGMAYNGLKDAVTAGYLDRMLFVDYNKLMSAPKMQLKRIYEFLEEPHFEHDFSNVEQIATGDSWRAQKLHGLHDVRKEFKKEPKSAREILGGDVYAQYDQPEPWSIWT